jgi:hypothetical protein
MITGCVVVRDEGSLLGEALASLAAIVDRIVVVDHGSADDSARIARAAGARVLDGSAVGYEDARNVYLDAVTEGWVLVLDADERIVDAGPDLRRRLRAWTEARADSRDAYALTRYEYMGAGDLAEVDIVRLWRARPEVRYARRAWHASVARSIEAAGGRLAPIALAMHHVDLLESAGRAAHKRARARARGARALEGAEGSPMLHAFMGLELAAEGRLEQACAQFAECAGRDPGCGPLAALFTAQVRLAQGNLHECERLALASLDGPRWLRGNQHGHALLAEVAARRGDLSLALTHALAARAIRPCNASSHLNVCALSLALNRGSPRRHFARALRANPWLLDPRVYAPGDRPTIYGHQRTILSLVGDPRTLGVRCGALDPRALDPS